MMHKPRQIDLLEFVRKHMIFLALKPIVAAASFLLLCDNRINHICNAAPPPVGIGAWRAVNIFSRRRVVLVACR